MTPLPAIYVANVPGVVINFVNLMVLARYSSNRRRAGVIIASTFAALLAVFIVFLGIFLNVEQAAAARVAGAIMACLSSLFFLSPLRTLASALARLDASAVPSTLCFVQLVQASNWIAVGVLYPDGYIIGVNCAGASIAGLSILVLQWISYRRRVLGMNDASPVVPGAAAPPVKAQQGAVVEASGGGGGVAA